MPALQFVRRHFRAALVIVVVVSAVGGWLASRQSTPPVDARLTTPGEVPYPQLSTNEDVVGIELPDISVTDESSQSVSIRSFTGRPLVINFWYSTCEPCRREMPVLAESATKRSGAVKFIGVNMNDSMELAREFADRYGVTYDLVFDVNGSLARALGVATAPVTLFVDPTGVIVGQVAGEITAATLDERLREWFSL